MLLEPLTVGAGWSETIDMVGIADYMNSGLPVVLKLETDTATDYFVGFNRATGVNSQNDEADNEVTIVETGNNGEGYSQSFLKATLVQGESYALLNFGGSGHDLVIDASSITDNGSNPWVATVDIRLGACSTNVECDDDNACNGVETCNTGTALCEADPNVSLLLCEH